MKVSPITCTICALIALLAACGTEVDSPPADSPHDRETGPIERTLWKVLGKETFAEFTSDELATVTHLKVTTAGSSFITEDELTLLAKCVNLTELELVLPVTMDMSALAGLHKLRRLTLGVISDLRPLTGLINLMYLDLFGNNLTDLSPLAGLVNLTYLDLSANRIGDLSPLAGLVNLTHLDLSANRISDLRPLAGLKSVQYLYLEQNQIIDIIPLFELTQLRGLHLNHNQIIDINPLAALSSLHVLQLNENQITDITPLKGLTALNRLMLGHNRIEDLKPLVANPGLSRIDYVFAGGNPLSNVSRNEHIPALEARGVIVRQ